MAIRLLPERQCAGCAKQVEWGCHAVRHVVHDDLGRPVMGADGGQMMNWHQPARLPLSIDGEETYACPRQTLLRRPREWNRLLTFYGMFKRGFLPEAGAVIDQSNKLIEAFRIMDEANYECDAAQDAERRQEQIRRAQLANMPGPRPGGR